MTITTRTSKGTELTHNEMDENFNDLNTRTGAGWKDLVTSLSTLGVPTLDAPDYISFGPSGLRKELAFAVGDYVYCQPFHVNHDVKIGGKAYPHVHWSTDGTSTNTVKWEFQVTRAIGHNQAFFGAGVNYYVEQAAQGNAWRHMIAEVATIDALTLTEPDELILITLKRVTNGGVDNPDAVFGITVDLHYEANRDTTPNKAPNFYV